jgi:hypothetical protein
MRLAKRWRASLSTASGRGNIGKSSGVSCTIAGILGAIFPITERSNPAILQRNESQHLTVLRGSEASRPAPQRARLPTLSAQPFRPGELPTPVVIRLAPGALRALQAGARAARVPAPLWSRCAVDAARLLEETAKLLALTRLELIAELDRRAERIASPVTPAAASKQIAYARALRRGEAPVSATPLFGSLTVLLPDTIRTAWACAASRTGMSMDHWIETELASAPRQAHLWEAASAEAGQTLAEWVYALALALATRR